MKGNFVEMAQSPINHKDRRSWWVFTSLLLIQIANNLTNAVSSELEEFRRLKWAQMKGNIVKMVQELKNIYIVSLICNDRVSGTYYSNDNLIEMSRSHVLLSRHIPDFFPMESVTPTKLEVENQISKVMLPKSITCIAVNQSLF